MNRCINRLLVLMLMVSASSAWAVDESRIWLPKKYQHVKPKLLAAAREAEATRRCDQVIAGEMIARKNTPDHYYFVITCRDDSRKTYNISYLYPVEGDLAQVVAEQKPADAAAPGVPAVAATGVDAERALSICKDEFAYASDGLDDASLQFEQLSPAISVNDGFTVTMPFTAQSELGERILYRAECRVDKDAKAAFDLILERDGALTICRDHVRGEAILLGRAALLEEGLETLPGDDDGFAFRIPLDVKTLTSSSVRFIADCRVDGDGNSKVVMNLQPQGAYTLCTDALRMETFLMKEVSIADEPETYTQAGERFDIDMAFNANDPEGNQRKFRARCQIDEEGVAVVETELDKSAIIAVCINGVIESARTMLGVTVLEDKVPPLQEDDEGFLGIIPFDAKDPNGRDLRYNGECRVDETGRTKVDIRVRRD